MRRPPFTLQGYAGYIKLFRSAFHRPRAKNMEIRLSRSSSTTLEYGSAASSHDLFNRFGRRASIPQMVVLQISVSRLSAENKAVMFNSVPKHNVQAALFIERNLQIIRKAGEYQRPSLASSTSTEYRKLQAFSSLAGKKRSYPWFCLSRLD